MTCADAYLDKLKSSQQQPGSMHSVNLSQAVGMNWPTVTVAGNYNRVGASATSGDGLAFAVNEPSASAWPTPMANSSTGSGRRGEGGVNLQTAIDEEGKQASAWATPASRDYRAPNAKPFSQRGGGKKGEQLPNMVRHSGEMGTLNPTWVEALLCWPLGWSSDRHMEVMNWPWAFHGRFVACRYRSQQEWEPPRTVLHAHGREKRIKAIGNGQDPSALLLAVITIVTMDTEPIPYP